MSAASRRFLGLQGVPGELQGHPQCLGQRVEENREDGHRPEGHHRQGSPGHVGPEDEHPADEEHQERSKHYGRVDDQCADPVALLTLEPDPTLRAVLTEGEIGGEGFSRTSGSDVARPGRSW